MLNQLKHQKGSAMFFSMIALLAMASLSTTNLQNNQFEEKMMSNYEQGIRAHATAESGLWHGIRHLETTVGGQATLNSLLAANGGTLLSHVSYGKGYYSIVLVDNNDGDNNLLSDTDDTVIIRSTATSAGASRTVEAIVTVAGGSVPAVLINGDLLISGNPQILGSCGVVQVNGVLEVAGDTVVSVSVNATDGIIGESKLTTVTINENAPPVSVPSVIPSSYRHFADFILASDGKVYDQVGTEIANTNNSPWNGWEKSGEDNGIALWNMPDDNTINNVTLYVEGEVDVSGSPYQNSTTDVWNISIIAERSIRLQGNPRIAAHDTQANFGGQQNLLLLAGGDINISGNPIQSGNDSFIAAHEQIEISGETDLKGLVVAEDASTSESHSDYASKNQFSGASDITSNGSKCSGSGTFNILSWVEI